MFPHTQRCRKSPSSCEMSQTLDSGIECRRRSGAPCPRHVSATARNGARICRAGNLGATVKNEWSCEDYVWVETKRHAWRSYPTHGIAGCQWIGEEQVTVRREDPVAPARAAQRQLLRVRAQTVKSGFNPHDEVRRGAGDRHVGQVREVRPDVP